MPEKGAPPNVHPVQRRVLKALESLSSPLLPDDYLELVNPLWSTRELRGRIQEVKHETARAATILIKPGIAGPVTGPGSTSGSASTSMGCATGGRTRSPPIPIARTG